MFAPMLLGFQFCCPYWLAPLIVYMPVPMVVLVLTCLEIIEVFVQAKWTSLMCLHCIVPVVLFHCHKISIPKYTTMPYKCTILWYLCWWWCLFSDIHGSVNYPLHESYQSSVFFCIVGPCRGKIIYCNVTVYTLQVYLWIMMMPN